MFLLLLVCVLIAAAVHAARLDPRTPPRVAEVVLRWLLAGYCGVPMVAVAVFGLLRPAELAAILGFPAGNPFQQFLLAAYLGLALAASLASLYGGAYLVGPAIAWATFWIGATWIHIRDFGGPAAMDPHALLHVFGTHGLIAVLLIACLAVSGVTGSRVGRRRANSTPTR